MALIFAGSSDSMSGQRTSRIIGPILRWIDPDIPTATVEKIQLVVRKTAHVTEYAVLAVLALRALRHLGRGAPSRGMIVSAWLIAVAYACTDEFHQHFVPNRQASFGDVVVDACGAALGLWFYARLLNRPPREPNGIPDAGYNAT